MNWIFAIFSVICGLISLRIVFGVPHFFHKWVYSNPKKLKLTKSVFTPRGIEKIHFEDMIMKKRECPYCGKVEYNLYDVQTLKDDWKVCSVETCNEYWDEVYERGVE